MKIISILLLSLGLLSCRSTPDSNTLTIGTIAGKETELVEVAKNIAAKNYGLNIKIIEFNDYHLPNEALQDGSLDANVYQHLPYLQESSKIYGYNFAVIGKTFVYPLAIYSLKFKHLKDLPPKSIIAIPNDPSNEERALLLLEKAKLITLNSSHHNTIEDIGSNPKSLQIKELDAAQLPRVLKDVDAAVINTTFALEAGLNPAKNGLFIEQKDSPYANLIVIKGDNPKRKQLAEFVKAMNSEAVKTKARELFNGAAIAAW